VDALAAIYAHRFQDSYPSKIRQNIEFAMIVTLNFSIYNLFRKLTRIRKSKKKLPRPYKIRSKI